MNEFLIDSRRGDKAAFKPLHCHWFKGRLQREQDHELTYVPTSIHMYKYKAMKLGSRDELIEGT